MTPEALLVVQICEHGLIAPPEMFSEIDLSAKLGFHLLLLTWLFHTTLSTQPTQLSNCEGLDSPQESSCMKEASNGGDDRCLPFEVVAVQYTILDGNPSLLVGVREVQVGGADEELPRVQSGGLDTFCDSETAYYSTLEAYIHSTPLFTILGGILTNETVQTLLSPATLEQLQAMVSSPLETIFSLQEDVTPLPPQLVSSGTVATIPAVCRLTLR